MKALMIAIREYIGLVFTMENWSRSGPIAQLLKYVTQTFICSAHSKK